VFASPAWARRLEKEPKSRADFILYDGHAALPKETLKAFPGARVAMRCNDMVAMAGIAEAGVGLVSMPLFLGRARKGLVQLPQLAPRSYADIWVVAHRDVWKGIRVRVLREALVQFFRANRERFIA